MAHCTHPSRKVAIREEKWTLQVCYSITQTSSQHLLIYQLMGQPQTSKLLSSGSPQPIPLPHPSRPLSISLEVLQVRSVSPSSWRESTLIPLQSMPLPIYKMLTLIEEHFWLRSHYPMVQSRNTSNTKHLLLLLITTLTHRLQTLDVGLFTKTTSQLTKSYQHV